MSPKITALFTFEILGKPPEHIVETMEKLLNKLGEQKGIEIKEKKIHEPHHAQKDGKDIPDLFSTFAEVEIETDNINLILGIVLNMLPAHVEIIKPREINFKNFELSSLLTELTVKIHKYDEVAKAIMIERNQILNKLKETEERARELEKEIKEKNEKEDG